MSATTKPVLSRYRHIPICWTSKLVNNALAFLDAYPFSFPTFAISQVIFLNFWKKVICLEGMAKRVSLYPDY